jgi:undecaprenyl-diphosphatase
LTVDVSWNIQDSMESLWIALLGAIQGATEFLPVSSSGHLAAGQLALAGSEVSHILSDKPLLLEVLLHLATLAAVVVVYRREVIGALCGAGRGVSALMHLKLRRIASVDDDVNLAVAIIVGTLPTGVIGLAIRNPAAAVSRSPLALGICFLGCACFLLASRWWLGGNKRLSWRVALVIGVVQGMAVLPGISRSGVTIVAALGLGLKREEAARFSFLLSIPAILGAAVLELDVSAIAAGGHTWAFALGALSAFVVGLGALTLLIRLVRKGRLWLFAPYVAAVGVAMLVLF